MEVLIIMISFKLMSLELVLFAYTQDVDITEPWPSMVLKSLVHVNAQVNESRCTWR